MVDKRDLRALRPQSVSERFQAVRLGLAGALLVIIGTLLVLAEIATHDSVAIGVAGIAIGVGVIVFSAYRRASRLKRVNAVHAAAASVGGYQLNRTYSDVAAAQEAAEAVRATPAPRRNPLLTVVIVVAALAALLVPAYRLVTKAPSLGTVVPLGTAQSVKVVGDDHTKTDAAGEADVTVTVLERATASDLADLQLTADEKKQTAYLVRYTATRKSGTFDPDDPGLFNGYNWSAVQADGKQATTLVTILPPAACAPGDERAFALGSAVEGCEIVLSDSSEEPRSVSFEESGGTFSWTVPTGR